MITRYPKITHRPSWPFDRSKADAVRTHARAQTQTTRVLSPTYNTTPHGQPKIGVAPMACGAMAHLTNRWRYWKRKSYFIYSDTAGFGRLLGPQLVREAAVFVETGSLHMEGAS